VDIANALCEQIKRKCEFVEQVWDSMIPGLNAKKYDVIISSMSITDDRMKEVDFTDKYYNTPSRIVLKKSRSSSPTRPRIKGKKIGVLKGSTQEKYALGELKTAGRGRELLRSPRPGVPGHQVRPSGRHRGRLHGSHRWLPEQARRRQTTTLVGPS